MSFFDEEEWEEDDDDEEEDEYPESGNSGGWNSYDSSSLDTSISGEDNPFNEDTFGNSGGKKDGGGKRKESKQEREAKQRIRKEISGQVKSKGKEGAKKVGQAGKKGVAKVGKAGGKAGAKLGKAGAKALAKVGKALAVAIKKLIIILGPYILVLLAVILLAIVAYYIVYEIKGTEQRYVDDVDAINELFYDEDSGTWMTLKEHQSSKTTSIQQFYRELSKKSYWQLIEGHEEYEEDELYSPVDTDIKDYYDREKDYQLNANLLYALNEKAYRGRLIYPEQFAKPVYFDPEHLVLLPILDEDGNIAPVAPEYNRKGEMVKEEVPSVADNGLGTVFKYKKATKSQKISGTITARDVFDSSTGSVVKEEVSEDFEIEISGGEDIWIIERAITFMGEFVFEHEEDEVPSQELSDGVGEATDAVTRVAYGTYTDAEGNEQPLYEYRTGGVFDLKPKPKKTHQKKHNPNEGMFLNETREEEEERLKKEQEQEDELASDEYIDYDAPDAPHERDLEYYFHDYLWFFKSNMPLSVLHGFDFEARAGALGSFSFGGIEGVGSEANSAKAQQCFPLLPTIEKYSAEFGVDPYLIMAKLTQESGCENINGDGIAQIGDTASPTVSAVNTSGQTVSFTANKLNKDDAVRYAVMRFKNHMDEFEGHPIAALLAFNKGGGGMRWTLEAAGVTDPWESDAWMAPEYREISRVKAAAAEGYAGRNSISNHCLPSISSSKPWYGDTCYLENVLRYYGGTSLEMDGASNSGGSQSNNSSNNNQSNNTENTIDGASPPDEDTNNSGNDEEDSTVKKAITILKNKTTEMFSLFLKDYSEEEEFYTYEFNVHQTEQERALRMGAALERRELFSRVDPDNDLFFWETGFSDKVKGLSGKQTSGSGHEIALAMLAEIEVHFGTPYAMVSDAVRPGKFDCSGLMLYVHKEIAGINLPRVTFDQAKLGEDVGVTSLTESDFDKLEPGDLLFFSTYAPGPSHVGMYEGEGMMLHTGSKKRGVERRDLRESYWQKTFLFARRLDYDEMRSGD